MRAMCLSLLYTHIPIKRSSRVSSLAYFDLHTQTWISIISTQVQVLDCFCFDSLFGFRAKISLALWQIRILRCPRIQQHSDPHSIMEYSMASISTFLCVFVYLNQLIIEVKRALSLLENLRPCIVCCLKSPLTAEGFINRQDLYSFSFRQVPRVVVAHTLMLITDAASNAFPNLQGII